MVTVSAQIPAHWQISTSTVGHENLPVVIIDNVLARPDAFVQHATRQSFAPLAPHYPGLRAKAPHHYLAQIMPGILPLLRDTFDYKNGADVNE